LTEEYQKFSICSQYYCGKNLKTILSGHITKGWLSHTFIIDEKDVALWPFRIFVINRNAANGVT